MKTYQTHVVVVRGWKWNEDRDAIVVVGICRRIEGHCYRGGSGGWGCLGA